MNFNSLLQSFKVHSELNEQFWDVNGVLHPNIRLALLRIAESFYNSIELDTKPTIKDIVFTGSLANYNYSSYSDVDLHLIFDFDELQGDVELIEQFFILAKSNWNDKHDITIKGYDVELYAEDYRSPHTSTGLYSVMRNQWIKEPHKQSPIYDILDVKTKTKYISGLYKHLFALYTQNKTDGLYVKVKTLRDKIRKFRQAGLDSGGEYSTENITFKVLRRLGLLDKLKELEDLLMDKQLTIQELA
jgi:hypothetical protein